MGDHQNVSTQEEDQLCYIDRYDINELIGGIEQNDGAAQWNESNSVCEYEIPFLFCNKESNREDSERNSSVSYLDDGASTIISKQDEDNGTEEDSIEQIKTRKRQTSKTKGKGNGKNEQTTKEKINIIFIPSDGSGLNNFEELLSMKNMSNEKVEKKLNERVYQICCKSVADINTYNLNKVRKGSERQKRGSLHVEHIDYGDIFLSIRDSVRRRERRSNKNLLLDDSRTQLGGRKEQLRRYTNAEEHQQRILMKRKVKNAYNYRCNGENFFKAYRKKDILYYHPIEDRIIEKGASHSRRRKVVAPYIQHLGTNKRRSYVPPADDRHVIPYDEVTVEDKKFVSNLYINGKGEKENVMYSSSDYEKKKSSHFSGEAIAQRNKIIIHSGRSPRGADTISEEGEISRNLPPLGEKIFPCEEHVGVEEQYYLSGRHNSEVEQQEMEQQEVEQQEVEEREMEQQEMEQQEMEQQEMEQQEMEQQEMEQQEMEKQAGSAITTVAEIGQRDKPPGEGGTSEFELNVVFDSSGILPEGIWREESGGDGKNKAYACLGDGQPGEGRVSGNASVENDEDRKKEEDYENTSHPINEHQTETRENTAPNGRNANELCHWEEEVEGACDESVVSLESLRKSGGDGGNSFLSIRDDKEYFDLLVRKYEKTKVSLDGSDLLSIIVSDAPGEEVPTGDAVPMEEEVLPTGEEVPTGEEAPTGEEVPIGEETPTGEEVPTVEEVLPTGEVEPVEEEVPMEEEAPTAEEVPMEEVEPVEEKIPTGEEAPADDAPQIGRYEELLENDMCDLYNLKMHDLKTLKKCDFGLSKNLLIKDIFVYHSNLLEEDMDPLDEFDMEDAERRNDETIDEDDGEIKGFLAKLKADVTSQISLSKEDNEQAFDLLDSVHANSCYYDCNGGEDFPVGSKLNLSDLDDDVGGTAGSAVDGALMDGALMDGAVESPPGGGSLFGTPRKMGEERKDTECQTEFPLDFSRNTNRTPRKKSVEVILVKKRLKRMKEKDDEEAQEGQKKWGVSQTDPKDRCRRYPRRNRIKTLRYWIGERELTKRNPYTGEIDVVGFSECTNLEDLSPHIIGPIKYKALNLRDMYSLSADDEEGGRRRGSDSVDDDSGDGLVGFHTDGQADGRVKTHASDHRGVGKGRKRRRSKEKETHERDDDVERDREDEEGDQDQEKNEEDSDRVATQMFSRSDNVSKKRRKRKFINIVNYIKKRKKKKLIKSVDKVEGQEALSTKEGKEQKGNDVPEGDATCIGDTPMGCENPEGKQNAEENKENLFYDENTWRFEEEVADVEVDSLKASLRESLGGDEVPGEEPLIGEQLIEEPLIGEQLIGEQLIEEQPIEEQPIEEQPIEEQPIEEQPIEERPDELPHIEATDQLVANEGSLEEETKEKAMEREGEEGKGVKSDGIDENTKDSAKNMLEKKKKAEKKKKDEKRKIKERRIDQMYKKLSMFNLDFLPSDRKVKASKGVKKDITKGRKKKNQEREESTQKEQISGETQDDTQGGEDKDDVQKSENTASAYYSELNGQKVDAILRTDDVGSTSGEEADSKIELKEGITNGTVEEIEQQLALSGGLSVEANPDDSEGKPLFGDQHEYNQQSKDNADNVKTEVEGEVDREVNLSGIEEKMDAVISANVDKVEEYTFRLVQSSENDTMDIPIAGEEEGHATYCGSATQDESKELLIEQGEGDLCIATPQNEGDKLNHMKEVINDEGRKFERNEKIKKVNSIEEETEMADEVEDMQENDALNEVPSSNRTDGHVDVEEKNNETMCTKPSRNYNTVLKRDVRVKIVHFDVDRRKHRRNKTRGVPNPMSMRRRGMEAENVTDRMGEVVDRLYGPTNILHGLTYKLNEVNIPQKLLLKNCVFTGICYAPMDDIIGDNLFSDNKVKLSLYSIRMIPGEKYRSSSLHHNLVGYVDGGEKIKIVLGNQERCFERGDFFFIPRFRSFMVDNCSR
eukprot:XP_002261733.1 hypothetical protein, conserved in Plasmodium species [Plasmodium knowlesi strain H]